jgi:quercetin dioxygenase-like cupin family protein
MDTVPAKATVQIDNDHVRVTEWQFPKGAETGWHRHELRYVVVPGTTGALIVASESGETRSDLVAGVSYFREAGSTHNVINRSDSDFVFVEIELKEQRTAAL